MSFDVVIIGSGPGGYVAAIRASQLGLKVAIVEKAELGGVCLNWGCIPTKALLKSAQVYDYINHAADYGIEVKEAKHDFGKVIKRSRDVAGGMSKGVQFLMKKNKIQIIEGFGKIKSKGVVEVDKDGNKKIIEAQNIILATGARERELPFMKIDGEKIVGYHDAMVLPSQPKKLVVVGSGAIGMEFAYFYQKMGTEVTIIEYLDRLLPNEDEDISKTMFKIYKKYGVNVMTNAEVKAVDKNSDGVEVSIETKKGQQTIQADIVLSAVGVQTNLENLGLEEMGIQMDKGRIIVNQHYQTNVKGIYAIGDITPGPALAHVASAEGIICVEAIAGKNPESMDYNNIPSCTYCLPEVASVGLTEKQATEQGYEIKVGKFPFSASGKAKAAGVSEGFVKVIFDAKYGEWLGAHMIGANVTEMIAEAVTARKLETTGHEIIKAVHPHPTMSEAVMEATAAAYDEVIHL
ncbi:MAG: dihydrolipoyl dehydrogenase [Bacteroidetes bacterium MED-G17]|nr:MAG: dihydrolipoyl dehydrogenase [Bacteroidetes bacterium MED-G17]|tara:strand:+ start:6054 stop:7439 length:1386 start_codon:yes stop_codon:yes gene_type:complete